MKKRKTFKELASEVPKPKLIDPDERLPSIFDTIWDAKTYRQLVYFKAVNQRSLRMLREHGYDTDNLPAVNGSDPYGRFECHE